MIIIILVRFVPKPDSCSAARKNLPDHFVGEREQGLAARRCRDAERPRGLEIDDEAVLGRELHRER